MKYADFFLRPSPPSLINFIYFPLDLFDKQINSCTRLNEPPVRREVLEISSGNEQQSNSPQKERKFHASLVFVGENLVFITLIQKL